MKPRVLLNPKYVPIAVTIGLFILMYGAGSVTYRGFFSAQVFLNLLIDNAFLGITAIGMTFVVISAGIDLSVGSVIAMTTMISAALLRAEVSPALVIPLVLAAGSVLGCIMGSVIHFFNVPAFIATLAGNFFARGVCYLISIDSITITDPFYTRVSQLRLHLGPEAFVSVNVVIFLVALAAAVYIAHYTRFGRVIYAIGGNEQSAVLMGLPVARTKVLVYTMSGFCSSLAGVVFSFYMLSGYGLHTQGLEMDAVAAAVMGGTLLSGGVGYVMGTAFGTLILGTIQTLIMFQGTLSSWWTKIVIGLLIFVFILAQALLGLGRRNDQGATHGPRGRKTAGAADAGLPARQP